MPALGTRADEVTTACLQGVTVVVGSVSHEVHVAELQREAAVLAHVTARLDGTFADDLDRHGSKSRHHDGRRGAGEGKAIRAGLWSRARPVPQLAVEIGAPALDSVPGEDGAGA